MMLRLLLDSAMRSLLLGLVVWALLKLARLSDTRTETAIWTAVLLMDQAAAASKGKDCGTALGKLTEILKLDFTIDAAHALRSDCLAADAKLQTTSGAIFHANAVGIFHRPIDAVGRPGDGRPL